MKYCSSCGKEIENNSIFCQSCGSKVGITTSQNVQDHSNKITAGDYETFIGKNSDKYIKMFQKFSKHGIDNFKPTWHWPAFFFGPFWMLYRKLYLWAIGAFIFYFFPVINIISWIVWGIAGYYIYYKYTNNKIKELKNVTTSDNMGNVLSCVGGVHVWLLKTYIALIIILFIGGLLLGLGAGIPKYNNYSQKHSKDEFLKVQNQVAQVNLKDDITKLDRYLGQHPNILFQDSTIASAFKELLSDNYDHFITNISVASDLQLIEDYYVSDGYAPHERYYERAAFGINKNSGVVYIIMYVDGKEIKLFGIKDEESLPPDLLYFYESYKYFMSGRP
jgi:hypothetical protein